MFRAIWEFAQSADCVAQTEDQQNACQSADWRGTYTLTKHGLYTCTCNTITLYTRNII